MPFQVPLKLKEGLNKVLVVARINDQVVTFRSVYVSRRATRGSEVAAKAFDPTDKPAPKR